VILYAATGNYGKLREFVAARGPRLHVHVCPCYATLPPCEETGRTFEANAGLKAEYYSRHTDGLVFADDSGLEVDALDRAPGVRSARYSGPDSTDAANNAKLLAALNDVPVDQRTARYVCVIALARDGCTLAHFRDTAEGIIISTPRGAGGFGYDPYFLFPGLGKTFAELSTEEKWIYSHRGKAFRKVLSFLECNHA
jgi:XTP/dITP diphosphohydrolase